MNEPNRTQWQIRCAFNGFCKRKISFTPTTLTLNTMKLKNPFVWQARK